MAHPLDEVVRNDVAPAMRELAFTRRGRSFWLAAESGSTVLVEFYLLGQRSDGVPRFEVISGLMLGVEYADLERRAPVPLAMVGSHMLRARLFLPPRVAFDGDPDPETDPVWALWPDRTDHVREALADVVRRDAPVLPDLVASPDRLVSRLMSDDVKEAFPTARPANAVMALIMAGRFGEALALVESIRGRLPRNAAAFYADLIQHWESLGCRRAPGDWQKYVKSAG